MLEDGEWGRAGLYMSLSVVGGLLLVKIGMTLADRF